MNHCPCNLFACRLNYFQVPQLGLLQTYQLYFNVLKPNNCLFSCTTASANVPSFYPSLHFFQNFQMRINLFGDFDLNFQSNIYTGIKHITQISSPSYPIVLITSIFPFSHAHIDNKTGMNFWYIFVLKPEAKSVSSDK